MFAIVIHHVIYDNNLEEKYRQYEEVKLINISCFWHVSSFTLISGIVGYKIHKYSNLIFLWFSTVFYSTIFYLFAKKYKPSWIKQNDNLFHCFFPVIFKRYWYFSQYFGMYLLLFLYL